MKEKFILESAGLVVALRTAVESDGEDLRRWKNANRHFFFYQEIISVEQQQQWLRGYRERADDWMFIVLNDERAIGCMGFRVLNDQRIDIYNVILGDPGFGGKGLMSQAMRLMCSYIVAQFQTEILAKVLNSNPAQAWYLKNGFRRGVVFDRYTEIVFNRAEFRPLIFSKTKIV